MIDSKLTFKIQEIPDGKSERKISLTGDDLELNDVRLNNAIVTIRFEKTTHFINTDFDVKAEVTAICDRSLEEYEQKVDCSYNVLFKPEVSEVSEGEGSKTKQFNSHELTLSIDKEVRDSIMLGLPIKKLHPRFLDDQGVPVEFDTKSYGDVRPDDEEQVDPRWEALKKLKTEN